MRTQTEVNLHIRTLHLNEKVKLEPEGFIIKVFLSCSRVDTKVFKANSEIVKIDQKLKIRNIVAEELEFWFCNTHNKIIAVGKTPVNKESEQQTVQFKLDKSEFGKLEAAIESRTYQIEKQQYIEPDEQLLKKEEDPQEKLRQEEEQKRKAKEAAELQQASKAKKKPAITLTQYKKKEQPFV